MKVHVYSGSKSIVERSGVGRAIDHQKEILRMQGVDVDCSLEEADVVHFNTVFPDSVLAAKKAKRMGKTIVYYGHSTMEDFKNSFIGSNLVAPLFKKWICHCYSLGDVIITPSEYSKGLLESYGIRKPICAVSNGIDLNFWKPSKEGRENFRKRYHLAEEDQVVISVGHYIDRKGIREFIDLARKIPSAKFLWFGYTPLHLVPSEIRSAIESAPDNLTFPGYIEKEELLEAYQGCDLFDFMSHEETEGIVILEAMACKTPTFVRDIPVYDNWLLDNVNVHKCVDDFDFTKKTIAFLKKDLPDLTEEGYEVSVRKSYQNVGKQLLKSYPAAAFTQ